MNIKNITVISLILVTNISNIHAMEPQPDTTQNFMNAMQTSEFADITQSPKFLALLQKPEFWTMMQTPQFQAFLLALNSKSYKRIQNALEDILETEALEDLFKTGIFSDDIRIKHHAMKIMPEYAEYRGAKEYYAACQTDLTRSMVDECKKALRNTKEYNNLIDAANAEMLPANNNSSNNTTTASSTKPTQSNITNNSHASSLTENSLSNEEIAFLNMTQTLQFKTYDQAKKLHELRNTPETKNLLEEALGLLMQTPESKLLLEIKTQKKLENNDSQIYSNNVITTHRAMEETPEYKQYEDAKLAYEQDPNETTKYMVNLCKTELCNTKECQEWVKATDQEQHITNNIANSEKWEKEQQYPRFQDLASLQKERNIAWLVVQQTKEYEVFKKAELAHKLHDNWKSASLLKRCQEHTKETEEYKKYFALDQQLRAITGEPQKCNIYSVQQQPNTNNNNNNDNNTTTASSTTQSQAIETFSTKILDIYQTIKETNRYKEYQGAKELHETDKTDNTHRIMCDSLSDLILTPQWGELVLAMRREKDPLNNIIQSEKWVAEQQYSAFPHLKGLLPTKKSQVLQVKLVDFLCNKLETQLLLTPQHAEKTNNNNNNVGITIQPYSRINSDCFIKNDGPKIDIPLTSPNNNYSPRETCVPREIRLQLTNNKK